MARLVLRGDGEAVGIELPDDLVVRVVEPVHPSASPDPLGVVADALDAPVDSAPLAERAAEARSVTVVVPDGTRAAATDVYLLPVLSRLAQARHGPRSISVLVARGIHPALHRDEVKRLVGEEVMAALKVVQSAPNAPELNVSLEGDGELGDVRVHRLAAEADLVLLTGSVVPHHLAGFGGGAKALVPGVAQKETVEAAHRLTLRTVLRPDGRVRSRAGVFDANPFRDALLRVARRHGRCFLLNVLLDREGRPAAAAAGEVGAAHEALCVRWQSLTGGAPVPEAADLVVVDAGPVRGRTLIQAHKALLEAAAWARPGAPIVWVAPAGDGPGHPGLLPWFEIGKPERHLAALRKNFEPYGLTAYSIRRVAKDHPVHVVSEMSRDLLRPMGLLPARTVQEAVDRALGEQRAASAVLLRA